MIKLLNSIGAAIASILAEMAITIIYLLLSKDIISLKDIVKTSYKYAISSIIMFIVIEILKRHMQISIQSLVLLIVIGMAIYGGMLLILKDKFVYETIARLRERIKGFEKKV